MILYYTRVYCSILIIHRHLWFGAVLMDTNGKMYIEEGIPRSNVKSAIKLGELLPTRPIDPDHSFTDASVDDSGGSDT